jgi:hypothetical protein
MKNDTKKNAKKRNLAALVYSGSTLMTTLLVTAAVSGVGPKIPPYQGD